MQLQQMGGMGMPGPGSCPTGHQQIRPGGQVPSQQMMNMNMAMMAGAGGPNVVIGPGGTAMVSAF